MAKGTCGSCPAKAHAEGLCWRHLVAVRQSRGDLCCVEGCGEGRFYRGMCGPHATAASKAEHGRRDPAYSVTCEWCGTEAKVTKGDAKFCSQTCAKAGLAALARPKWHEAKRRLARAERGRRRGHPLYVSSAGEVTLRCPWGRSDNHRGDWISRADRLAVYERDGWVCQLCSDPVDPDLEPHDIWAATLDHIVCRSWTEEPDDSPENLRLAHRWCNSVRGDETYYPGEVLAA